MKILYLSALSSSKVIDSLFKILGTNPGFAVQKFSRLIVTGLKENGANVSTLSVIPVSSKGKFRFVKRKSEDENLIKYNYVPFVNFPLLKHFMVLLYTLGYLFIWGLTDRKNKVLICDALNVTLCMAALIVAKFYRLKIVCVLTDMPGLLIQSSETNKIPILKRIIAKINETYLSLFSHYIVLTKEMNDVVNKRNKPYIVMEGLVDSTCLVRKNDLNTKTKNRVVLYAGGLFEKYGLNTLVQAFMKLPMQDLRLVIYGNGPYVDKLKKNIVLDNRIVYKGVRPNAEVVADEVSATLLVNPRPTKEEFTKYSFPSKNMEYMASGTPLLTTKLPGMPQEYCSFVYTFEDESIEGFEKKLTAILSETPQKLHQKGLDAQNFIVKQKNNVVQCQRILKLINQ